MNGCPVAGPRVREVERAMDRWYEDGPDDSITPANRLLIEVCQHWCNQCQAHVLDFMNSDTAWTISWLTPLEVRDIILKECDHGR